MFETREQEEAWEEEYYIFDEDEDEYLCSECGEPYDTEEEADDCRYEHYEDEYQTFTEVETMTEFQVGDVVKIKQDFKLLVDLRDHYKDGDQEAVLFVEHMANETALKVTEVRHYEGLINVRDEDGLEFLVRPNELDLVMRMKGQFVDIRTFTSKSEPNVKHTVRYYKNVGLACNCAGFVLQGNCWHTREVKKTSSLPIMQRQEQ